jgi:hypothetical protein
MRLKPLFLSLLITCTAWAGAPLESANKRVEVHLVSTPNDPREIIAKNPELQARFEFLKDLRLDRKVTIAVIGDYIYTDSFSEIIDVNKAEVPGNNVDDDENGFTDDVLGLNLNDRTGNLNQPVTNGHENGIVSLLHAFILEARLQDSIHIIPININAANNRFDELYIKKLADGIDYSVSRGAQVITMSLGVSENSDSFFKFIANDKNKSWAYYLAAVRRAVNAGVILFGSASNDPNRNQEIENDIPSNSPGVIGVSNVNFAGVLQGAYGKNIQVAYYGTDIYVWNGFTEGFRTVKGTSFATPMVALTAAIGKSIDPKLNSSDVLRFKVSCEKKISGKRSVGTGCIFSPKEFIRRPLLPSDLEITGY